MSTKKEAVSLVVITLLIVILIYSSLSKFNAFGQYPEIKYDSYEHCTYTGQYPPVDDLPWGSNCCGYKNTDKSIFGTVTPPVMVCQICKGVGLQKQCFPPHQRVDATLRPAGPQQPPPNPPSAPPTALFNSSPGAGQFNAPITTTTGGSNTSNPSNNNTTTGGSLNTLRGTSSATRTLMNGNSPAASAPQPSIPYSTTINSTSSAMKAIRGINGGGSSSSPTGYCSVHGQSNCVPCDPTLPNGLYNCIPQSQWHPTPASTGLPVIQQPGTIPENNAANPGNSEQQPQQQQPTSTTTCPDGSQPDANGKCPSSTATTNNTAGLLNKAPTDHTERCFAIVKGGGQVCKPSGTTNTGEPVLCPDGSQPDANGKCPSSTTSSTNSQQLAPSSSTPPEQHHHKGKNLSSEGGSTTKKGNNNNDVSSSPPT
jgi:hypothetical protein